VPTYQYACTECEHGFEAVQSFSDDALTECPACAGRLRKVFASVGIVFKGSGFYRNDSREAAKSSDNGAGKDKAEKTDKPEKVSAEKGDGGSKGDKGTGKKPASDSPSRPGSRSGSSPKSSDSGAAKKPASSNTSSTAGSAA